MTQYKAERCDMCDFIFLLPGEKDYYYIMIPKDGDGKGSKV